MVPGNAVDGSYSVFLGAFDAVGNQTSTPDGAPFEIVAGSTDSTAPQVSDLVVPTSGEPVRPGDTITVQWRATDDAGVGSTFPWIAGADGNLIGPDGVFYGTPSANASTLISGTATDGVYQLPIRISASIPVGDYVVRFTRRDVLGNHGYDVYRDGSGRPVGFTV